MPETTAHPIDIIDGILRPLLGSMPATQTAVTIWHALRKAGHLAPGWEDEGTIQIRPELKI